ncbi:MAG: hypothetical protein ABIA93_00335 [Candidatus Woesearchaeota archaeon]
MNPLILFSIVYVAPLVAGTIAITTFAKNQKFAAIHIILGVSIIVSMVLADQNGISIPFGSVWSLGLLIAAMLFAAWQIGWLGVLYTGSSFLQEFFMALAALFLLQEFSPFVVIPVIAIPFGVSHIRGFRNNKIVIPALILFGLFIVGVFILTRDPLICATIHAIVGSVGAKRGYFRPAPEPL